jgi:hypothetical protein
MNDFFILKIVSQLPKTSKIYISRIKRHIFKIHNRWYTLRINFFSFIISSYVSYQKFNCGLKPVMKNMRRCCSIR